MRSGIGRWNRRRGAAPLLFVVSALVVIALADLWIYRRVEESLDAALAGRLESVVRTLLAAGTVQGDAILGSDGGFDAFELSVIDPVLQLVQVENDLDAIFLLDPDDYTIGYSSSDLYAVGAPYPHLETHGPAILEALMSEGAPVAVTPTLPVGPIWLKCGFAPVHALLGDGELVAILVVEASADFFGALSRVRGVMWTGMIAAGVLLLLLITAYLGLQRQVDRARLALEREDRMAALGRLASQVAHEIRNPVGIIKYSAERLGTWLETQGGGRRSIDPQLLEMVAYIEEETGRLQDLTERYLTYTRQGEMEMLPIEPAGLIESARLALERTDPPEGIALELEVEAGLPAVTGDMHLLRQALLNLGTNALEALGTTGRIVFFARQPAVPPEGALPSAVLIGVEDDGPGIPPRLRKRIFEPFFTTRTDGNGLGLAIVREIAVDHGGGVELECPPEGGTRIAIRLPAAPVPGSATGPAAPGTPARPA